MLCKNCGKEINNARACSFCGYDPALDDVAEEKKPVVVSVPPLEMTIEKRKNGAAVAGFIMSFFSYIPTMFLLSFIFNVVGFFKAKYRHSGRGLAVFGLLFNFLPIILCVVAVLVMIGIYGVNGIEDMFNGLMKLLS